MTIIQLSLQRYKKKSFKIDEVAFYLRIEPIILTILINTVCKLQCLQY